MKIKERFIMAIYTSITDLIGGTPLLELKNYEAENWASWNTSIPPAASKIELPKQ